MSIAPRVGQSATSRRRHLGLVRPLAAVVVGTLLVSLVGFVPSLHASLEQGGLGAQVLIGADDDNINNPAIQPSPPPPDQSLSNADVLVGGASNDVLTGAWSPPRRAGCPWTRTPKPLSWQRWPG
jgi:hypothetical protein